MPRRRRTPSVSEPPGSGASPGAPELRYLVIAQVVRPHGLRGHVRCKIITEHPERFADLRRVTIGDPPRVYRVRSAQLEGDAHAGTVLLGLVGVNTPEQAEALRGALVTVPERDAVPLGPGEYYTHQIIGLNVITDAGEALGTVVEVLSTGANDVFVVRGPRGEVLLPAIQPVVREIDVAGGRMVVTLIEGLLAP
jgi:16S rRNA processing protein RimM